MFSIWLLFCTVGRGQSCHQKDPITTEHHFRVDFFATFDYQLQKLNDRFREDMMELLMHCSALDPRDDYKYFNINDTCKLVKIFYLENFSEQEKLH